MIFDKNSYNTEMHTDSLDRANEIIEDYTSLGYIVKRYIMVEV